MTIDVAAVVNLHAEGHRAAASTVSAWRAAERARLAGYSVELLLLLDSPTAETRSFADDWRARGARIVEVGVTDLGEARNAAATATDATWLAFLDGDDLWSENWLERATTAAVHSAFAGAQAWHPQVNVIFGDHHSLLHHVPSTDARFSAERARLHNPWTALAFVERQTVLDLPYPRNDLTNGLGFEDWSWNLALLRLGGQHHVVEDTCHFIRRRHSGSLLGDSQEALRAPHDSVDETQPLPGRATQISAATPQTAALPPTHRSKAIDMSPELLWQVSLAERIEPAIRETISSSTTTLPQNFNDHVTQSQRALEELELIGRSDSAAAALSGAALWPMLPIEERDRVCIEFLRGRASTDGEVWDGLDELLHRQPGATKVLTS